jgi:signal peptidase I
MPTILLLLIAFLTHIGSTTDSNAIKTFIVEGPSMSPTYVQGQKIKVDENYYKIHPVKRGDIIIFNANNSKMLLKRVIGLPGEKIKIERDKVYINDAISEQYNLKDNVLDSREMTMSSDEYFVIGDNYNNSLDSRLPKIGPVKLIDIVGKVIE